MSTTIYTPAEQANIDRVVGAVELEHAWDGQRQRQEVTEVLRMVADSAWTAKDWTAARRAYALVLSREPNDTAALNRTGRLHLMRKELDEAIESFSAAFLIDRNPTTCINLAVAYGRLTDFTQALYWCAEALLLDGKFQPAFIHMAALYEEMGQLSAAEEVIARGLEFHPQDPQLLYAQGLHRLMRGDYERGWAGYEHRINRLNLCDKLDEYPEWTGESLTTEIFSTVYPKTILVCWEQGFGDQIMWARYLPLLAELGGTVVLFTRPELARLFAAAFPAIKIVTTDQELKEIEPDYWVAMGSLPMLVSRAIPVLKVPLQPAFGYLHPIPADVDRFRPLVPADGNLRVGLCWAGSPDHFRDRQRSMTWEQFKPLLSAAGCTFYSLQRGERESGLPNLTDYCHDVADTAAAIACLDLVISVDTMVLHLAGALGVQTWGIVPPEWRWGAAPSGQTPWYPSVDLFPRAAGVTIDMWKMLSEMSIDADPAAPSAPATPPIITKDCRYGRMPFYRNDHYIGRALDLYGEYSQSEADLLRRVLKPGDVVIEAGANVGGLTVAMADAVGRKGFVYAHEPQPSYHEVLYRNFERSTAGVYLSHKAFGAECRNIEISAVPLDRTHAPGWKVDGLTHTVEMITIDSYHLERLALIKIDVDGQELEILKGAEATIARCRPIIYVENDKIEQYPDLMPWLIAHGYRLYQHYAPLFNPDNFAGNKVNVFGSMVSAMLLCIPQERKDVHPGEWGLQRIRAEKVAA